MQQQLILQGGKTLIMANPFTDAQEPPQLMAEMGQPHIVSLDQVIRERVSGGSTRGFYVRVSQCGMPQVSMVIKVNEILPAIRGFMPYCPNKADHHNTPQNNQ